MAEFDPTNRGQIWKNEKKEKDSQPDFTGTLNVQGLEFFVSAWKRKPDANPKAPALSFSIQSKDQRQDAAPQRQESKPNVQNSGFDDPDLIPF